MYTDSWQQHTSVIISYNYNQKSNKQEASSDRRSLHHAHHVYAAVASSLCRFYSSCMFIIPRLLLFIFVHSLPITAITVLFLTSPMGVYACGASTKCRSATSWGANRRLFCLTYSHKTVMDKGSNQINKKLIRLKKIRKCMNILEFGFNASTLKKEKQPT